MAQNELRSLRPQHSISEAAEGGAREKSKQQMEEVYSPNPTSPSKVSNLFTYKDETMPHITEEDPEHNDPPIEEAHFKIFKKTSIDRQAEEFKFMEQLEEENRAESKNIEPEPPHAYEMVSEHSKPIKSVEREILKRSMNAHMLPKLKRKLNKKMNRVVTLGKPESGRSSEQDFSFVDDPALVSQNRFNLPKFAIPEHQKDLKDDGGDGDGDTMKIDTKEEKST
jgi:hypothetical protein